MESKKFTFIMYYDGGSYISQYEGKTPGEAFIEWTGTELSDLKKYIPLTRYEYEKIKKIASESNPIPVDGLINIWNNDLGIISKTRYLSMAILLS